MQGGTWEETWGRLTKQVVSERVRTWGAGACVESSYALNFTGEFEWH